MAYCKTSGACGRSHVLFAAIDLKIPQYRQICIFKKPESSQAVNSSGMPLNPDGSIDYSALHGIIKPTEVCQRCERPYSEHKHKETDQNGWAMDGCERV